MPFLTETQGTFVKTKCAFCGADLIRPRSWAKSNTTGNFYCNVQCVSNDRKLRKAPLGFVPNNTPRPETKLLRIEAMKKISPELRCIICGCTIFEALEINHKNGGGNKEYRKQRHLYFYKAIISGRRKTDDLEIRCKVCNIVHLLEMLGISGFKVAWCADFPCPAR